MDPPPPPPPLTHTSDMSRNISTLRSMQTKDEKKRYLRSLLRDSNFTREQITGAMPPRRVKKSS